MPKLYLTYVVAALAPAVLCVLVQIPIVWHWHNVNAVQQQRSHIKEEVLRLQALTMDMENGFRGYVLTKQSVFLQPVVHGEAKVQGSLNHLSELTKDLPNLRVRVNLLQERIHELIETKRRLTRELDRGNHETVLSHIRLGDGLALSKTIEKAMEDLESRVAGEFVQFEMEQTTLQKSMLQKLLIADAGTLLLGIIITRIVFRTAADGRSLAASD
jgi:CHASE3 domain sensor protein